LDYSRMYKATPPLAFKSKVSTDLESTVFSNTLTLVFV